MVKIQGQNSGPSKAAAGRPNCVYDKEHEDKIYPANYAVIKPASKAIKLVFYRSIHQDCLEGSLFRLHRILEKVSLILLYLSFDFLLIFILSHSYMYIA